MEPPIPSALLVAPAAIAMPMPVPLAERPEVTEIAPASLADSPVLRTNPPDEAVEAAPVPTTVAPDAPEIALPIATSPLARDVLLPLTTPMLPPESSPNPLAMNMLPPVLAPEPEVNATDPPSESRDDPDSIETMPAMPAEAEPPPTAMSPPCAPPGAATTDTAPPELPVPLLTSTAPLTAEEPPALSVIVPPDPAFALEPLASLTEPA
jgi:hypothetical protein